MCSVIKQKINNTITYWPGLSDETIASKWRHFDYWFTVNDFISAFVYWLIQLSPYHVPVMQPAVKAFQTFISGYFVELEDEKCFTYNQLKEILSEDYLKTIPAINALTIAVKRPAGFIAYTDSFPFTDPDYGCIDLSLFSHNMFYMMLRLQLTKFKGV